MPRRGLWTESELDWDSERLTDRGRPKWESSQAETVMVSVDKPREIAIPYLSHRGYRAVSGHLYPSGGEDVEHGLGNRGASCGSGGACRGGRGEVFELRQVWVLGCFRC